MIVCAEFSDAGAGRACHPVLHTGHFPLPVLLLRKARFVTDWSDCIRAIAERRDRAQFQSLFLHFAPRLKSFFLRSGAAPGLAEDLAQETMLAVWRKANQFDPEKAQVSTWVFTIARNLRIDARRRERDPQSFAEFFEPPSLVGFRRQ